MPRYGRRTRLNRRPRRQFRGVVRTKRSMFRRGVRGVVRRMAESKFNTRDFAAVPINTVPILRDFSGGVIQGTGPNDRIGRNISVNTLTGKFWLSAVAAQNGQTRVVYRLILFYPRKSVDDVDTIAEIASLTVYNRPDPSLVMVLWERRGYLGTIGDTSIPSAKTFKYIQKRSKYQFNYTGNGAVKREPTFAFVTNLPALDPTKAYLNGYTSMSFKDI